MGELDDSSVAERNRNLLWENQKLATENAQLKSQLNLKPSEHTAFRGTDISTRGRFLALKEEEMRTDNL